MNLQQKCWAVLDAHLYSTAGSMWPSYLQNALHLPPQQDYSTQPWCEDSMKPCTYPCRVGLWPVCPLMPWHYQYSFTPEWGEALSIWSEGVLNPSYLSFDSGQSQTHNLSHTSQELYQCATNGTIGKALQRIKGNIVVNLRRQNAANSRCVCREHKNHIMWGQHFELVYICSVFCSITKVTIV